MSRVLVATESNVVVMDSHGNSVVPELEGRRPTCLAADSLTPGRVWCGTHRSGVFRSDDEGASWRPVGLEDLLIMSIASSPGAPGVVWAGTEPSAVWRSRNAGDAWEKTSDVTTLPSSPDWSFPPRPETHHVRWIACHPHEPDRLWVAIEAGALISTHDAGRTWRDRVPGGPWDTHELAIHPAAPESLRVAAGDGYFESDDGGATWQSPGAGLDVGYLRSVAIDPGRPDVVVVSASSGPRTAYGAGVSDGRLYRRVGRGEWQRVRAGWPDPPATIAPLLVTGANDGELWAADERGVHRSVDGGASWDNIAGFAHRPTYLRGLTLMHSGQT